MTSTTNIGADHMTKSAPQEIRDLFEMRRIPPDDWAPENAYATGVEDGVTWELRPGPFAGFNGYVILPKDHPWFDHEDADDLDVPVHGGVTLLDKAHGRAMFDTAHYGDWWPDEYQWMAMEIEAAKPGAFPASFWRRDDIAIRWTLGMVIDEAKRFARLASDACRRSNPAEHTSPNQDSSRP